MSDFWLLSLIVFVILSLLVTIVAFLIYSGLLSDVNVRTGSPPIKNVTIAYKFREGPYKECGSTFTESCTISPKLRCIGVYYDNPDKVPAEKCRCAVGKILSEGEEKPDEELVRLFEKFGFKIFSFPEVTHAVTATFPNRTPLSFLLGIYKVYPKLMEYIKEHQLPLNVCLEIYEEEVIHYMSLLDHASDFQVPELRDKEEKSEERRQMDIRGVDSTPGTSSVSPTVVAESQEEAPTTAPTAPTSPEQECKNGGSNSDKNSAKSEDSASSFEELDREMGREQEDAVCPPAKEATGVTSHLLTNEQAAEGEVEE